MSETTWVSDIFQLIDMKVLITEDTLDSLLSIKISSDGGKTYTDYSVSSLKNGITFNCSPNDLKVICDANVLKYIQVLADGEKSTSNVDLSDYLKYRDIYVDVYKNPYYRVDLTDEEVSNLSSFNRLLYDIRGHAKSFLSSENSELYALYNMRLVSSTDGSVYDSFISSREDSSFGPHVYYISNDKLEKLESFYYAYIRMSEPYIDEEVIQTNVRVHFIKHL